MTTQQVNDIINRSEGRIDIMLRTNGISTAYEKNINLPFDITDEVEQIFSEKSPEYIRINLYTTEGQRPIKTFNIDPPAKAIKNNFSGVSPENSSWFFQNEITRLNNELTERKSKCNILYDKLNELKEAKSESELQLKEQISSLKEEVRFAEREAKIQMKELATQKDNTLGGVANKLVNNDKFINMLEKVAIKVMTPHSTEVSNHQAEVKSIEPAPTNYSPMQLKLAEAIEPLILSMNEQQSIKLYEIMHYISMNNINLDIVHDLIEQQKQQHGTI